MSSLGIVQVANALAPQALHEAHPLVLVDVALTLLLETLSQDHLLLKLSRVLSRLLLVLLALFSAKRLYVLSAVSSTHG